MLYLDIMKEKIFDLLVASRTLQDFVNASSRLLNIPYWVMNESFGLIAVSRDPLTLSYKQQLLGENDIFHRAVIWTKSGFGDEIKAGNKPVRHFDEELQMKVVLYDIYAGGQLAGRLTFFPGDEKDISDAYVQMIADACAVYLRDEQLTGKTDLRENFLLYLLDRMMPEDEIVTAAETVGWNEEGPYRLALLECNVSEKENPALMRTWLNHLRRIRPEVTAVFHNGRCAVLETRNFQVSGFLDYEEICAGFSLCFDELRDAPAAETQALYALEKKTGKICCFEDLYEQYFTEILKTKMDSPAYILPGIRRMREYDKAYKTHYLETLTVYYDCGESKEKTARSLDIHLNSVKYRLQQMQKLFGIDIGKDKKKIQLSLLLM